MRRNNRLFLRVGEAAQIRTAVDFSQDGQHLNPWLDQSARYRLFAKRLRQWAVNRRTLRPSSRPGLPRALR